MADLVDQPRLYSCFRCRNIVSCHDDIVSKNFLAGSGRAFLFSHVRVRNIVLGPEVNREMITGLHKVADVFCSECGQILGWKYELAYMETEKYKEGKFILAKFKIVKENW